MHAPSDERTRVIIQLIICFFLLGEYYSTQSDAHVSFVADWDVGIIDQMEATGDELAVLSTYLTDVVGSISPSGKSLRNTRPIMCNTE